MKKPDEAPQTEEESPLHVRLRASTVVSLQIPLEVLASLAKVAASRDMSMEALLKLYVGQGLRQDLSKQFADRVMEKTAQVLRTVD